MGVNNTKEMLRSQKMNIHD